jgi:hypothetical protein
MNEINHPAKISAVKVVTDLYDVPICHPYTADLI